MPQLVDPFDCKTMEAAGASASMLFRHDTSGRVWVDVEAWRLADAGVVRTMEWHRVPTACESVADAADAAVRFVCAHFAN